MQQILYLPVSVADLIDPGAQAIQENARVADAQTTAAASGSCDLDGFADALGAQTTATEAAPQATILAEFSIAAPTSRGRAGERDEKDSKRNKP